MKDMNMGKFSGAILVLIFTYVISPRSSVLANEIHEEKKGSASSNAQILELPNFTNPKRLNPGDFDSR